MDDRYDLILGMPWLVKHEPWIDWRTRTIGASHKPLADRALTGHVLSSSRDGFVHEHRVPRGEPHFAGSAEHVSVPNNQGGRAEAPAMQGVQLVQLSPKKKALSEIAARLRVVEQELPQRKAFGLVQLSPKKEVLSEIAAEQSWSMRSQASARSRF